MAPRCGYRDRVYEHYASSFQRSPLQFDRAAAERWGKAYDYYLRRWLPADKHASIVDLACGSGRLLHFWRQRGYTDVFGVDVSAEQVSLARQVTPNVCRENVLQFLSESPARFDLITGIDLIEHLTKEEIPEFLDLCYKALRPEGRLVLQTPNSGTPRGVCLRYGDFTHEVGLSCEALCFLLRTCGFDGAECREQGPVPWGYHLSSSLRYLLWRVLRLGSQLYNIVETGSPGNGVLTRVFLVSARKEP
jgi:SAM-dependent methyltransferase